jgi:protein involved in polysaccharide export with SLBB domain
MTLGMTLSSCSGVPSEREQELLIREGFGKRASGDAQVENYASVGSTIQFIPSSQTVLMNPGFADLALLVSAPQVVAVDGTVYLPNIGPVLVLGLTEKEIGQLITEQLGASYKNPPRIDARIVSDTKYYYVFGEGGPQRLPLVGDEQIVDVFAQPLRTPYSNLGKIRLIRADPRNPLIISINLRDIVIHGVSTYNLRIRENDIIYVPPTFFGMLSRFIEKLLLPLNAVVRGLFEVSNLRYQYGVITGSEDYYYPLIF